MPVAELWEEICCGQSRFERPTPMKQTLSILARQLTNFFIVTIISTATLLSQHSVSNQVVTLEVLELNKVVVSNELLALESPGYNDFRPEASVVTAQTRLVWTSNGDRRKISVASKHASTSCVVHVTLQEVNGRIGPKHELELRDSSTHDFIRGLSKSAGSCGIRFSVYTSDPEGGQVHVHSIVYTVTST